MEGKSRSSDSTHSTAPKRDKDKPQNFDRAKWRERKMAEGKAECPYCGHWFRKPDQHAPCPKLKLHEQRVQAFNQHHDSKSLNGKEGKIVPVVTYDDDAELASRKRGRVGFKYGKGPMLVKEMNRKA